MIKLRNIFFLGVLININALNSQVMNSGMSWLSVNSVFSAQSPVYNSLDCSNINYQINSNETFKKVLNGSPYNNDCLFFPADINISTTYIDMSITFNQPVSNLKIRFVDLDENVSGLTQPEESLSQMNPLPSNVQPLNIGVNPFFLVGGIVTPYDNNSNNDNNDASGWVSWTGDITSVSFRYNRPKSLYALIIDSIYFDCPSCVSNCDSELEMPNVFTPNGDGINDIFTPIVYSKIENPSIIILNRWGNIIYKNSNPLSGWDGTSNGKKCTEGVYFWRVDYDDINASKFSKHGFIHLEK
jgi:gliding motility-associated-like protein